MKFIILFLIVLMICSNNASEELEETIKTLQYDLVALVNAKKKNDQKFDEMVMLEPVVEGIQKLLKTESNDFDLCEELKQSLDAMQKVITIADESQKLDCILDYEAISDRYNTMVFTYTPFTPPKNDFQYFIEWMQNELQSFQNEFFDNPLLTETIIKKFIEKKKDLRTRIDKLEQEQKTQPTHDWLREQKHIESLQEDERQIRNKIESLQKEQNWFRSQQKVLQDEIQLLKKCITTKKDLEQQKSFQHQEFQNQVNSKEIDIKPQQQILIQQERKIIQQERKIIQQEQKLIELQIELIGQRRELIQTYIDNFKKEHTFKKYLEEKHEILMQQELNITQQEQELYEQEGKLFLQEEKLI